jgi:hypothetical protein
MPIGPYKDFDECVSKNSDKANPEGFCAWLEKKTTGKWPSQAQAEKYPEPWYNAYDAAMVANKSEKEAIEAADKAVKEAGFELSRFGWVKQLQSPTNKSVAGVKIFGVGTWIDSAGNEKTWPVEDLDKMVDAFTAGVPKIVPIKCGHTSDKFNLKIAEALGVPVELITGDGGHGQIKLGNMTSLQRKGELLVAAFDKVPEAIANLIEGGQYSTVSVEIEDKVGDFGPVITGVALLGAEEPAVDKATLERALVFAKRQGARVLSFTAENDEQNIKEKIKAAFAGIGGLIDRLTSHEHSAPNDATTQNMQDGRPPKAWWDRCVEKVSGWSGVNDTAAFCGAVWAHDDPIPASSFASDEAANQAQLKYEEANNMDLKKIAQALGLAETCTEEEILAAIANLKGSTAIGEMSKALKDANDKIDKLEKESQKQAMLTKWTEKTSKFSGIPGKPVELATQLADIEAKAGVDAANTQFAALESANNLAVEAQKTIGTNRVAIPTDFDNEVAKYQKENSAATKAEAVKAVSKARPDLYFARPERQ